MEASLGSDWSATAEDGICAERERYIARWEEGIHIYGSTSRHSSQD